jgi:cation diffusion facilitator CzcD-associated flavoprotein CzcO
MAGEDELKSRSGGLSIAIIGGGLGGVAAAVKFQKAGFRNFTIFEQSPGAGGVWHDNTYPGCEVDIQSHIYSYSFMSYDWTRTHATQPEIKRYIEDTIDAFDIRKNFRFSTRVEDVTWQEEKSAYSVRLAGGEVREFDAVVSCVGILNVPKYPDWPGLDTFKGIKFHTSRWDHSVDLTGKRVAVVGTGSTGVQLVSGIAPIVGHLHLFQREPGWIIPKGDRDFTPEEREQFRKSAFVRKWMRYKIFRAMGRLVKSARIQGTKGNTRFREMGLAYLNTVKDPEVRRALTPNYPFGCKRIIQCGKFYDTMNRDNVTLVPFAVERVTDKGVVAANGVEYPVDMIAIGVGFRAQEFLGTLRVCGIGGRNLHEAWGGSAKAFLGVTVPGFPNFFILYGPNTNGGASIIYQHERQAEAIVRMLRRIKRGSVAIDTKHDAFNRYISWIDRVNAKYLSATYHCHNYFFGRDGRNVTQWPLSATRYMWMLRFWFPLAITSRKSRRSSARSAQRNSLIT